MRRKNSFAVAYNEPVINFPDSDVIGGQIIDGGNLDTTTFYSTEPRDPSIIVDPIVSEVGIMPPNSGGGIYSGGGGGQVKIDTNMNPAETDTTGSTDATIPPANVGIPAKKSNFILIVGIIVLAIIGIVYFSKSK